MAATARLDLPPAGEPAARIDRLRRQLRALEAATGLAGDSGAPLALRNPVIDGALGGGLSAGALHETAAARERDVLWAVEAALRCRAVGMVMGEMRARGIDQVATRRLALAAAAGNALGLILRTAPDDGPSAAATRWIVGAAPFPRSGEGDEERHGVGPPRLAARLV